MAKHAKVSRTQQRSVSPRAEESILQRSAESIGRVIGLLQREINDVGKRLAAANGRHDGRGQNRAATARSARSAADGTIERVKRRSPRPSVKAARASKTAGKNKAPRSK